MVILLTWPEDIIVSIVPCDMIGRIDIEEVFFMKAVKTHAGSCGHCSKPAAYAQKLSGGRQFLFCEEHVPLLVKKQAEATEAANSGNVKK